MKRINSFFSVTLLAAVMFSSCQDRNVFDSADHVQPSGEQAKLHIGLNMQSNFQSGLRAISVAEEIAVKCIDVLVFKDSSGVFVYSEHVEGTISGSDTSAIVKTNYENNQQLVVITNASKEVSELVNKTSKGALKDDLLAQLTFSLNGVKGNATSATNFTVFPMWGESSPKLITKDSDTISVVGSLLRMVARIDVANNVTAKFEMDSVYLYNTNPKGFIVPQRDENNNLKVPAYSPGGIGDTIGYDIIREGDERSIYTFETVAPNDPKNARFATCIVVAGRFKEGGQTDTKKSYYRVDFLDATEKYADILRNHCYKVTITDVRARGYGSRDEAFEAKSINIVTKKPEWDNVPENAVVNDQYYLAVNVEGDSILRFSKEQGLKKTVTIDTDYNEWKIIDSPDWVDFSLKTGKNRKTTIEVTTNQGYPTNRTGIIKDTIIFQAGLLKRKIAIQRAEVDEITINFYKGTAANKTLLQEGEILDIIPGTGSPIGVIWTGGSTATNQSITIWTTPYEDLTYTAQASFGVDFIGNRPELSLFRTADHGTSGVAFPVGLRLRAQASNQLITVEKSIVLKFAP